MQYEDDAAEAKDAMNHILPLVQSPQQAPYSPLLVLFYFFSLFILLQEASKQQRAILGPVYLMESNFFLEIEFREK